MILNEYVNDFFSNYETQTVEKMKSAQDKYNNIDDPIETNQSNILNFTIKGDGNDIDGRIAGIIDYFNAQFVIKKLEVKEGADRISVIKRLLNSVIVNIETDKPEIDTLYWRINKNDSDCIKACADVGFDYQDDNNYSMEFVYNLASSPVRQNYNTRKVTTVVNRMMFDGVTNS